MKELVFSIEDIFNRHSQDGCLSQYDCMMFHIPAYQRGYKWSSDENGAVSILLEDLWDAYLAYATQQRKEYYLQYITVKKNNVSVNNHSKNCLEVIDGQQRLTTLSILLSVFSTVLNKENISEGKLHYAIRDNFFTDYIYPNTALNGLIVKEWNELEEDNNLNKQDIFYMFHAVKKCNNFLSNIEKEHKEKFYNYLCSNVKLIVNSVENHVESESVFKNLNSNRVPLTEAELIKGFLITKVGRIQFKQHKAHFKEILEIRANIGRKWDEISRWANNESIRNFFFNDKDGMHQLLVLTAMRVDGIKLSSSLFNDYHKYGKADELFQILKNTQSMLNDWFINDELYNLLGFCRFAKKSPHNKLNFLIELLKVEDKKKLKDTLNSKKQELLQSEKEYKDLKYGDEDNDKIHAVLLALNVFCKGMEKRFDFYEFNQKKWSLEHIFPQSPEGKNKVLNDNEKLEILDMLGEKATDEIRDILNQSERTEDQKQIYYRALQEHKHLNSIGNMCLLTSSDNSSNGCMFFSDKRKNILKLIQKGSFVPKHTFDVFSKMMDEIDNSDLSVWSKDDIEKHIQYIQTQF